MGFMSYIFPFLNNFLLSKTPFQNETRANSTLALKYRTMFCKSVYSWRRWLVSDVEVWQQKQLQYWTSEEKKKILPAYK